MQLLFVALAIVACASAVHGRDILQAWAKFPPYACDSNAAHSPYALLDGYTSESIVSFLHGAGQRICVTGAPRNSCPRDSHQCCKADFDKLEFDVAPKCKFAVKNVTVNGVSTKAPTYNTYGSGKAVVKLTGLGIDKSNVDGAVVCFDLYAPCASMTDFCARGDGSCDYAVLQSGPCKCCPVGYLSTPQPPPPRQPPSPPPSPPAKLSPPPRSPPPYEQPGTLHPPPPPSSFPFCECAREFGTLPFGFSMTDAPTYTERAGNGVYCYTLGASECDPDASKACAPGTRLDKIEFLSASECRSSIRQVTIDGARVNTVWDGKTARIAKLALKASDIEANPKQVCIELQATAACPTLDKFCAGTGCLVSYFDQTRKICPTVRVPV